MFVLLFADKSTKNRFKTAGPAVAAFGVVVGPAPPTSTHAHYPPWYVLPSQQGFLDGFADTSAVYINRRIFACGGSLRGVRHWTGYDAPLGRLLVLLFEHKRTIVYFLHRSAIKAAGTVSRPLFQ